MILQPILMSDASNPSPQEKKFKKFPTSFRWSSQKAQTAQLKCREAEVVRNLETQHENTLEIGSVSFQKRWIKKEDLRWFIKMGAHYGVVEIHQLMFVPD